MFNRLRVFFGSSSRPQTAPQQYSVTRRCSGIVKSSAPPIDFSTYSAPRTDFLIARPRSNNSSFIDLSLLWSNSEENAAPPLPAAAALDAGKRFGSSARHLGQAGSAIAASGG